MEKLLMLLLYCYTQHSNYRASHAYHNLPKVPLLYTYFSASSLATQMIHESAVGTSRFMDKADEGGTNTI